MRKRVSCNWFLSDGVLAPVRLDAAEYVRDALIHAGVIEKCETVEDEIKNEWIYRRSWVYTAKFQAETRDNAHQILYLDGLKGDWTLCLNEQPILEGCSDSAEADLSKAIRDGENELEIYFDYPTVHKARPQFGFRGACLVREAVGACISSFRMRHDENGNWTADFTVYADEPAACGMNFALRSVSGKLERTYTEELDAGETPFSLTPFGAEALPNGERVTATLTLLINGKPADETDIQEYLPQNTSALRGFCMEDEFTAAAAARAGANAVSGFASARFRTIAADHKLAFAPLEDHTADRADPAMENEKNLSRLTGENLDKLNENAVWYLTDSSTQGLDELYEKLGDWSKTARISRYQQAAQLRRKAAERRLKNEEFFLADIRDANEKCASRALFDAHDIPRPAYTALMNAWRPLTTFALPPETLPGDGIINLPVYLVCDEPHVVAAVQVSAYRLNGTEIGSTSFPVTGKTTEAVGKLCLEVPKEKYFLLRTSILIADEPPVITDELIAFDDATLFDLPETQILIADNKIQNVGDTAALGVSIPDADFFGTILPGDEIPLKNATNPSVEGLNIYL